MHLNHRQKMIETHLNGSFGLLVKCLLIYSKLYFYSIVHDFFHESIGVANTFRRKPVLKYLWYLHFRLLTTLLQKLIADNQFVSGTLPNKVVVNKFKISDDLGFFCFSFPSLWPGDWKHNELDVNHIPLQIMRYSFYHVVPSL